MGLSKLDKIKQRAVGGRRGANKKGKELIEPKEVSYHSQCAETSTRD